MNFIVFIAFLITQRSVELYISKRNEKWLLSRGAIEYGREHYPYIVALHTLFILSLIAEYYLAGNKQISYLFLLLFVLLLMFKYWALSSLGSYWNTRIYRIPGSIAIKKGPYKLFRHPNYMDVIAEIAIIPLVFHLYYTAIIFSALNAVMLMVRIRVENRVWNG
ncbi:MAG: isoprenylcysteine carboxyl methyltransferase family protein [Mucilaginibacter sp.]